jgi:ribose 5-phosphate isomerase RpiB
MASNRAELEEIGAATMKATNFSEYMKLSQEQVLKDGQMPGWLLGIYACFLGGGAFWVAAVVCGIIGALRPARRQLAIGALAVCAIAPMFCCCGGSIF